MYDRKKKKNNKPVKPNESLYKTNALSQPDKRQYGTDIAIPDDYHVEEARDWCIENKK